MAGTPSPLPAPPEVPLTTSDLLLLASANAVNGQHPQLVAGVGSTSGSVGEAVQNTQAAAQYTVTQSQVDQLNTQGPKQQQTVWDGLDKATQAQYKSLGYQPPRPSGPHSFWGGIEQGALRLVKPAGEIEAVGKTFMNDVAKPILGIHPIHEVAQAAGAPLRMVQHLERTAVAAAMTPTGTEVPFGKYFTLSDWANAWNETSNGQQFINPRVKRDVAGQYGADVYNLAIQLAMGKSPQQILQGYAQPQQAQIMEQLQSPKVVAAVNHLNAGHLSPGRAVVGVNFISHHPDLGNKLSGSIDGLFDFFSDPLNVMGLGVGGKAADAKYLVRTPDDVQAVFDKQAGVRNAMSHIADVVRGEHATANLIQMQGVDNYTAAALVQAQADTQEKVLNYFKSVADKRDIIEGTPTNVVGASGTVLPRLTRIGALKLDAKNALQHSIDLRADKMWEGAWTREWDDNDLWVPGTNVDHPSVENVPWAEKANVGLGRMARALLTLEPQTKVFQFLGPDALSEFRDIALRGLPRNTVNDMLDAFSATNDIGVRWSIYRSMMLRLGYAMGLAHDPAVWERYVGKFASTDGRVYGPNDEMWIDGNKIHAGLLRSDMAQQATIPSLRDMYLEGRKAGIANAVAGPLNAQALDRIMQTWRSLTLARIGFATRVAGEEAALFMLREGAVAYMKGQAARSLVKSAARAKGLTTELEDDGQAASLWDRWTGHLPKSVVNGITTGHDLYREHLVDMINHTVIHLPGGPSAKQINEWMDRYVGHEGDSLPDIVNAQHHPYDPGQLASEAKEDLTVDDGTGSRKVVGEIVNSGRYSMQHYGSPNWMNFYYHALHQITRDDWAHEALFSKQPAIDRLTKVADKLQADPAWKMSARSVNTSWGKSVLTGETTERGAALDHAQRLIDYVDGLVKVGGKHIVVDDDRTMTDFLLETGKPPSIHALNEMPTLPDMVRGPELVPVGKQGTNFLDRASNNLFEKVISPQINFISRKPIYLYNYAHARQLSLLREKQLLESGMDEGAVEDLMHANAVEAAMKKTITYVHNPALRSEMSVLTRNLAPFWFAQEQFYKRWARSFMFNPAGFRKAQLMLGGLRNSGFIHKDPETGQSYFVYPLSAVAQNAVADTLAHVGINAKIPVSGGLTGSLNMLSPGLQSRAGIPSWGPLITVPLNGLQSLDPNLHQAVNDIEGPAAANSGLMKALFPATVMHGLEVAFPTLDSAAVASAQLQAIQAMEATGHGIGVPATNPVASTGIANPKPGDYVLTGATVGSSAYVYQGKAGWVLNDTFHQNQLIQRVRNWSRAFLITRLLFGFGAPASPQIQLNPGNLNSQYRTLLASGLSVDDATVAFLAEHPNATAETIFSTQSETGGTVPDTAAAMKYLDANPQLINNHSQSAPFFIPAAAQTGKFSQQAYLEQLKEGLRQRKDPTTFYNEVVYQESAAVFFKNENLKYQLLAQHAMPVNLIDDYWTQWSEAFMQANPIFRDAYTQQGPMKREAIMEDVGAALSDGSAPENPQTAAVKVVYDNWALWRNMVGSYGNPNTPSVSYQQSLQTSEQFAEWLSNYVSENPGVKPLVDRGIRPDLDGALTALSMQGVTLNL